MSHPGMTIVSSSLIESVGYDKEGRKLFVKFHSGPSYIYEEVGPEAYQDLLAAPSVGRFFLKEIKGVYPSKKLDHEEMQDFIQARESEEGLVW